MKKQYLWLAAILLCSYSQAPVEEKEGTYLADDDHGHGRGRGGHYDHHDDHYHHHHHDGYDDDGYYDDDDEDGPVGIWIGADPEDFEDPSVRDRDSDRSVD